MLSLVHCGTRAALGFASSEPDTAVVWARPAARLHSEPPANRGRPGWLNADGPVFQRADSQAVPGSPRTPCRAARLGQESGSISSAAKTTPVSVGPSLSIDTM
jgi:hypothetical protein